MKHYDLTSKTIITGEMQFTKKLMPLWHSNHTTTTQINWLVIKHIDCHCIFDIKWANLHNVAEVIVPKHHHQNRTLPLSVEILFAYATIAALNGMKVMTADIENAYLTAPCREKIWCKAGREFESFSYQVELRY